MIYLGNNQVGHDAQSIGFPTVGTCNAIVYQTTQALYGLHNMGSWDSAALRKSKAVTFGLYVQQCNIPHTDHATNLYSVVVASARHGTIPIQGCDPQEAWNDELIQIAESLKYNGTITLISIQKHIEKTSGTFGPVYIQYDARPGGASCDIYYKKMSKMDSELHGTQPPGMKELFRDSKILEPRFTINEPQDIVKEVKFKNPGKGKLRSIADDGNATVRTIKRKAECILF
jgi:hypothetical protein